jgi:type III pantothenate kinase
MNLVVDSGNTRFKVGVFDGSILTQKDYFILPEELNEFMTKNSFDHVLVSSVNHDPHEILTWSATTGKKIVLTSSLAFPITISYATPATLGVDRIAAACGAFDLFPEQDCLVIDAGTCLNYEFISHKKIYQGGGISPGISMRFEAMHAFTTKLPLVKPTNAVNLIGDSTETCMQSGVMNGIVAEVEGIIERYKTRFPNLKVILCGGDYSFFENRLKPPIFVTPDLVLCGLNRILCHHAEF